MAIREIRKEGDEILRKQSRPVTDFDSRLWTLLDDLAQTMYKGEGVGLAAPQVGILRRAVVIDIGDGVIELVNPEITCTEGTQVGKEGCLSSPGEWGIVERPNQVTVKAQSRTGEVFEISGSELLARAFCHEIDHLNGVLFKDIAERMVDPNEEDIGRKRIKIRRKRESE